MKLLHSAHTEPASVLRRKWRPEGDIDATLLLRPPPTPAASTLDDILLETQRRKRGLMFEVYAGNWVAAEAMKVVAEATEGHGGNETSH
jgi:hypothetical protein